MDQMFLLKINVNTLVIGVTCVYAHNSHIIFYKMYLLFVSVYFKTVLG